MVMIGNTALARVCYEARRILSEEHGDHSMREWRALATPEMRAPFKAMVDAELAAPGSSGDRLYTAIVSVVGEREVEPIGSLSAGSPKRKKRKK